MDNFPEDLLPSGQEFENAIMIPAMANFNPVNLLFEQQEKRPYWERAYDGLPTAQITFNEAGLFIGEAAEAFDPLPDVARLTTS